MSVRRLAGSFLPIAVISGFYLAAPLSSRAQAWLPPKGEGSFSFAYNNAFSRDHVNFRGNRFDVGHTEWHNLTQYVEYGLTDKIALDLSLPLTYSIYRGKAPHPNVNHTDDGNYHGSFSDFRFNVRYNLRRHPLVITPFIGTTLPSHNYETWAHSAIGTDVRGVAFGVDVGRVLDPVLPRAFFQAQASYAVVEHIAGYRPNRSQFNGELGYFVTRRLALTALQNLTVTYSGCLFPGGSGTKDDCLGVSRERTTNHDRIFKGNFLNLGGGFSLALSDSWGLFGSAQTTVWGRNGHALNHGFVFGFSRTFRTWRARPKTASLFERKLKSKFCASCGTIWCPLPNRRKDSLADRKSDPRPPTAALRPGA